MMPLAPAVAFGTFLACQAGLVAAGVHRLWLLLRCRPGRVYPPLDSTSAELPRVTVQLPLHN